MKQQYQVTIQHSGFLLNRVKFHLMIEQALDC